MIRERDWSDDPVIIVVAPTGAEVTRDHNPALPHTPQEIARSVIDSHAAGASAAHLHVREADGTPSSRVELFAETIGLIRAESDIVTMVSTGGAIGMSLEDRMRGLQANPDMAGIEVGSMNWGSELFVTLPHETERIAREAGRLEVGLEVEAFEVGHVEAAVELCRSGILPEPLHANLVLGTPGAMTASARNLMSMANAVPGNGTWCVTAVGRHQVRMLALGMLLGANCVRVGLEDAVYLRRGQLAASNAELVANAREIAQRLGRRVASTSEARRLLSLASSSASEPGRF